MMGPDGTEGVDWFKIGNNYYTVGNVGVAKLTATNERRSWIDLNKEVEYTSNATHFDDQIFYFNINVKDKEGEDIWFSV